MQSRGRVVHASLPALHLDDRQIALHTARQHPFTVEHQGQLATGKAIDVGYLELADEGDAIILRQVAFYFQSAQRVGAVQHDKLLAVFGSGFHS